MSRLKSKSTILWCEYYVKFSFLSINKVLSQYGHLCVLLMAFTHQRRCTAHRTINSLAHTLANLAVRQSLLATCSYLPSVWEWVASTLVFLVVYLQHLYYWSEGPFVFKESVMTGKLSKVKEQRPLVANVSIVYLRALLEGGGTTEGLVLAENCRLLFCICFLHLTEPL